MNRALVAVALVAACDKRATPAPHQPPTPPAPILTDAKSETTLDSVTASVIPSTSRQLITGVIDDWSATRAQLQLWSRPDGAAAWTRVGSPWDAVIGGSGAAWGRGLHGAGAATEPTKQEGDDKSPAGAFRLRSSYGYSAAPPDGTKLPYSRADKLECVDDPDSKHYTQILAGTGPRDWKSSEEMRRRDDLYTWVIDIAHNPDATPRGGSCIFFHVWGGASSTTIGCTAMAAPQLVELMKQLDPAADPVYVMLPRDKYKALRPTWGLP